MNLLVEFMDERMKSNKEDPEMFIARLELICEKIENIDEA
jgi:hypothetical protein